MARKNRNRIKKDIKIEEPDIEEDTENVTIELEQERQLREFDTIYEMRREMIEYCNNVAIPLCDYLTIDAMLYFIDFLREQK